MSDNCEERIKEHYVSRMDDLRTLWRADRAGYEGGDFNPVTNDEECPVCEKEVAVVDVDTNICRPCWAELYNIGTFNEYGLSFDYVPEGTFGDQEVAYFRYQISWGGPSDEFRFFVNPSFKPYRIEYWFQDWYDGAKIVLEDEDEELLEEIFEFFREVGSVEAEYEKWKEG